VDVTPARTRDNLGRLAEALKELNAKLRVPELDYPMPIALDERTFDQGTTWTFVTNLGFLDVALLPDGTMVTTISNEAPPSNKSPIPSPFR
jgi:hypothetical protein